MSGFYWDEESFNVVTQSFLESQEEAENERKSQAYNRLALLHDDWYVLLEDKLRERFSTGTFTEIRKYTNTAHNLYKLVVTRVSKIYNRKPKRIFTGNQKDVDMVNKLYKQMKIDQKWKKINRYINAVNDVMLQVVWRNDAPDIDIITPNIVSVIQNIENPTLVDGVIIEKQTVDTVGDNKLTYAYWDKDRHFYLDGKMKAYDVPGNPERINPYGRLPFVFIHRQIPDLNFWDETSGTDLYEATFIVGIRNTLLDYYNVWNSFKQLAVVAQDQLPEGITLDPSTAIQTTSQGATIQVLDFQANFTQLRDDLKAFAGGLLNNYGLSLDAWNENKPTEYSGKALMIKNEYLETLWQDQIQVFSDAEYELFEMIKFIYEFHSGKKLNCELKQVKYPPIVAYFDEFEQLNLDVAKVKAGFLDAAEVYARYHGYDDIEVARKEMLEVAKHNAELSDVAYTMASGFSKEEFIAKTTKIDSDEEEERMVE
jgi:hypothetical protein